jgi:hypothetical protein
MIAVGTAFAAGLNKNFKNGFIKRKIIKVILIIIFKHVTT